jgi:hypothetical protein
VSAQPARHLRLIDAETGELVQSDVHAELEELRTKFKMSQRDVAAKNLRIAALEADKARDRLDHPRYQDAVRVARYWWRKCKAGNGRVHYMAPTRLDAVLALMDLEELVPVPGKRRRERRPVYTMAHFKAAIDGAAFDCFETKRRNGSTAKFDDLELICRSAGKFDEFIAKAPYPLEVAERALMRDNPSRVPTGRTTQRPRQEVRVHHDLGVSALRVAVLAETGRPYLRARVDARAAGAPASV